MLHNILGFSNALAYVLSPFQNQCFKKLERPSYIDTMPFKFHHISSFKQIFIDVSITGVKREFIVLQLFAVYFAFAHKNMKSQCRNPLFFSLNFSKP